MPSHYLKHCYNIVNYTLRNKLQWNFNCNSHIFIQENAFRNGSGKWWPFCLGRNVLIWKRICKWQIKFVQGLIIHITALYNLSCNSIIQEKHTQSSKNAFWPQIKIINIFDGLVQDCSNSLPWYCNKVGKQICPIELHWNLWQFWADLDIVIVSNPVSLLFASSSSHGNDIQWHARLLYYDANLFLCYKGQVFLYQKYLPHIMDIFPRTTILVYCLCLSKQPTENNNWSSVVMQSPDLYAVLVQQYGHCAYSAFCHKLICNRFSLIPTCTV